MPAASCEYLATLTISRPMIHHSHVERHMAVHDPSSHRLLRVLTHGCALFICVPRLCAYPYAVAG